MMLRWRRGRFGGVDTCVRPQQGGDGEGGGESEHSSYNVARLSLSLSLSFSFPPLRHPR